MMIPVQNVNGLSSGNGSIERAAGPDPWVNIALYFYPDVGADVLYASFVAVPAVPESSTWA